MASPSLSSDRLRTGEFSVILSQCAARAKKKFLLANAQQRGHRCRQPGGEGKDSDRQVNPDSLPPRGGGPGWRVRALKCRHSGASRTPSTHAARGGARTKEHGPGFRRGDGEFGELLAHQLLLLLDIFLGNVAGRDERVDAGFGHITGVLLEADVEKLAANAILIAELVVLPGAGVLHRLGDGHGLRAKPNMETSAISTLTRYVIGHFPLLLWLGRQTLPETFGPRLAPLCRLLLKKILVFRGRQI